MSFILQEVLAAHGNYGGTREAGRIQYLVLHYTGNDGDTALSNARYFQDNVVKASAHYFVDDGMVCRSVPELRTAWAVGGKKWADCAATGGGTLYGVATNVNSISVELCDTRTDGVYGASDETLENAIELCREIMRRYEIPIERVVRHFDVTGKHCPAYMMDEHIWKTFKTCLTSFEPLDNTPSPVHREGVEWAVGNGILSGDTAGNLKLTEPVTRQQLCTMLFRFAKKSGTV